MPAEHLIRRDAAGMLLRLEHSAKLGEVRRGVRALGGEQVADGRGAKGSL